MKEIYRPLKDVRKNRLRNIVLAIDNLLTQMGEPENARDIVLSDMLDALREDYSREVYGNKILEEI